MKPQLFVFAFASLGLAAVDLSSDKDLDTCPEEHMRPYKGDVFTYGSPNVNMTCDVVVISFPPGDPRQKLQIPIDGDNGPCAEPEELITLPTGVVGPIRLTWMCSGYTPYPCRIITIKDEMPCSGHHHETNSHTEWLPYQLNCTKYKYKIIVVVIVGGDECCTSRTERCTSHIERQASHIEH
ncbi:uncharacterized protein LMH87_007642 [Akanthomyces muscarius]|uniref:Uncharacterized protein n=1 Tax=Akanthomyces muscarius TaxID=2231603 RepID=A0A9W8QJI4_AKAMU|nr:uncharacterized protein LMH87_007642 [Akanthomyces muscarius]KAJ4161612.1 hypothetical protein LMH87_007642 [Akanthomyces muscarius]